MFCLTAPFSMRLFLITLTVQSFHLPPQSRTQTPLPNSPKFSSVQSLSHVRLCNPMDCSTPGFPVHHQLPEPTQIHVLRIGDAIQASHPLLSPSPPIFNLFQHQGLFKWVSSSHQVAKVFELQLLHQSFQWILRTDFWVFSNTTVQKHQFFGTQLSL